MMMPLKKPADAMIFGIRDVDVVAIINRDTQWAVYFRVAYETSVAGETGDPAGESVDSSIRCHQVYAIRMRNIDVPAGVYGDSSGGARIEGSFCSPATPRALVDKARRKTIDRERRSRRGESRQKRTRPGMPATVEMIPCETLRSRRFPESTI